MIVLTYRKFALFSCDSSYGSEVGSVGIKLIPSGGLYVTGGLTPKNIKWIEGKDSCFLKAYLDKGRVSPILDNIPLFAVMVEDLGVRGARKNAEIVRLNCLSMVTFFVCFCSHYVYFKCESGTREVRG